MCSFIVAYSATYVPMFTVRPYCYPQHVPGAAATAAASVDLVDLYASFHFRRPMNVCFPRPTSAPRPPLPPSPKAFFPWCPNKRDPPPPPPTPCALFVWFVCFKVGLPGTVEAHESVGGVPESVWTKVQAVKQGGGGLAELKEKVRAAVGIRSICAGGAIHVYTRWYVPVFIFGITPGAGDGQSSSTRCRSRVGRISEERSWRVSRFRGLLFPDGMNE